MDLSGSQIMATPTRQLISSASPNVPLSLRGRPHDASVKELNDIRSFIEPLWREKSTNVNMVQDAILHTYGLRATKNQLHKRFHSWNVKKNNKRHRRPGPAPSLVLGPHLTLPHSVGSNASQIVEYQSWTGTFLSSMQDNLSQADFDRLLLLIRLPFPDDLSCFCRLPPSMGPPEVNRPMPYVSLPLVEMSNHHKSSIPIDWNMMIPVGYSRNALQEGVLDCEKKLAAVESTRPSAKSSSAYEALKFRLGSLYFQLGNLKAAMACFEHVFRYQDDVLSLVALMNYLAVYANIVQKIKKIVNSRKLFHAAFRKASILLKPILDIPSIARFFGILFQTMDYYDEAEELYLRSAQQSITSYGLKNINTYQAIKALAHLKMLKKDVNQGRKHYESALKLGCTVPHLDARKRVQDMLSFAQLLEFQRSFEYGREVLEATLGLAQKTLDLGDPLILEIQDEFAIVLKIFKEVEKAETLFRQNISAWIEIDGNNFDSAMKIIHHLGTLLIEQGKVEEALEWPFKMFKYSQDDRGMFDLITFITLEELLTYAEELEAFKRVYHLLYGKMLDAISRLDNVSGQSSDSVSDAQAAFLKKSTALTMHYVSWVEKYHSRRSSQLSWVQLIDSQIARQEKGNGYISQKEQDCAKACKVDQDDDLKYYLNLEDTD